jgi:hypothetical protein
MVGNKADTKKRHAKETLRTVAKKKHFSKRLYYTSHYLSLPHHLHMKSHLAYIIEEGTKIWAITQLN